VIGSISFQIWKSGGIDVFKEGTKLLHVGIPDAASDIIASKDLRGTNTRTNRSHIRLLSHRRGRLRDLLHTPRFITV
jgi:hypothetical protein